MLLVEVNISIDEFSVQLFLYRVFFFFYCTWITALAGLNMQLKRNGSHYPRPRAWGRDTWLIVVVSWKWTVNRRSGMATESHDSDYNRSESYIGQNCIALSLKVRDAFNVAQSSSCTFATTRDIACAAILFIFRSRASRARKFPFANDRFPPEVGRSSYSYKYTIPGYCSLRVTLRNEQ